jgi:hypothetical protein
VIASTIEMPIASTERGQLESTMTPTPASRTTAMKLRKPPVPPLCMSIRCGDRAERQAYPAEALEELAAARPRLLCRTRRTAQPCGRLA